jgi:glycosyltransferase involved in cell wall biosynthesis
MMRVIHLVNHCDRGGNVHVAVDLACLQSLNGHVVMYASAGGRYEDLLAQHGVQHEFLPQNLRNPLAAGWNLARLIGVCRSFRPDILHAHMMSGAAHGYLVSRLLRMPLVTTVHNSFDRHSRLMRLGDRVVAVSESERSLLLKQGYQADRLHVVLNGTIGTPRDDWQESQGEIELKRPSVTTVCGLERRKGVHDLIEAFRIVTPRAPAWHLYIAGDGPERRTLEHQAGKCGIADRVHFLGHVDNPKAIFAGTDIFVLASHAEPFGLSISEARHAGCAVIGTSVGGISEQLEHGRAGKLVQPGDPAGLARQLEVLMTNPAGFTNAKERAKHNSEYFNVRRVFDDYLAVYETALKASSRAGNHRRVSRTSHSSLG